MNDGRFLTWGFIAVIVALILACILSGCQLLNQRPDPIPENHTELLLRVAEKTNWMVTLSILGIAGCTFAFLNGNKWGLTGIVACIIILSMSLMVIRYATWLAIGGLIGSIGLVVWSIFIKNKALQQIIQGVQKFRYNTIEHEEIDGILQINQDKSTEKIVRKVKENKKCW